MTEETGAIRTITGAQAEQLRKEAKQKGIMFDRVPAKAIFQRKAGTGKRKCRACACGNFMTERPLADTYAGGTGAAEVRAKGYGIVIVILQPPKVFILAGACQPGTLWPVDRTLFEIPQKGGAQFIAHDS